MYTSHAACLSLLNTARPSGISAHHSGVIKTGERLLAIGFTNRGSTVFSVAALSTLVVGPDGGEGDSLVVWDLSGRWSCHCVR